MSYCQIDHVSSDSDVGMSYGKTRVLAIEGGIIVARHHLAS